MMIDDNINTHRLKQQFGLMKTRGTVGAIFIVRQITEKANERQVPLHFNCVDFRAAFDTILRGALWKTLRSVMVNPKVTSLKLCNITLNVQSSSMVSLHNGPGWK